MPKSDGYKNLNPVTNRTKDEARTLSQKGGIASGKKRREQREARECAKALLSHGLTDLQGDMANVLTVVGVKNCERNQRMALLASMLVHGQMGNTKAAELVLKVAGEMPADKTELTGANGAPLVPEPQYNFDVLSIEEGTELVMKAIANEHRA